MNRIILVIFIFCLNQLIQADEVHLKFKHNFLYENLIEEYHSDADKNISEEFLNNLEKEDQELFQEPTELNIHRYFGYSTLTGAMTNTILGLIMWNKIKNGTGYSETLRTAHRIIGYTTMSSSIATTFLGIATFNKLKHKKVGKTKRIVHMSISLFATSGFISAALLARQARENKDKPLLDAYSNHKKIAIIASSSVLATIIYIIW